MVKENLPANAGDAGLIPGLGRSPGEGHSNPLEYSCLENSMDRGAWPATVHRVAKSRTQLSDNNKKDQDSLEMAHVFAELQECPAATSSSWLL